MLVEETAATDVVEDQRAVNVIDVETDLADVGRQLQQRRREAEASSRRAGSRAAARATSVAQVVETKSGEGGLASCLKCRAEFVAVRVLGRWIGYFDCAEAEVGLTSLAPHPLPTTAPSLLELAESAGGNPWGFKSRFGEFEAWPERRDAYSAAERFADAVLARTDRYASVRGLLLVGDTGLAKTHLAHCVLYRLLDGGLKPCSGVLFDNWDRLAWEVKAAFDSKDVGAWQLIRRRLLADVWICTDLFAGKVSPFTWWLAYTILDGREGKASLADTNEVPDVLQREYGHMGLDVGRVVSRLGAFGIVRVASETDGRFARTRDATL